MRDHQSRTSPKQRQASVRRIGSWVKAAKPSNPRTNMASEWLVQANREGPDFRLSFALDAGHKSTICSMRARSVETPNGATDRDGTPTSTIHRSKNQGPRTDVVK